ncbi:NAD kinase [Amnibacterium sp. CER49]|uniref:NAD kinase n=1 Tax=Amnibacterium sp. CER49 TaxID=3039161 RepID=UPI00244857F0|nr:NAD kinase [Amnibacterium sp. CER49]MDH2444945.1 NAD kinase [Amnibacterium sp. CER49]
MTHEPRHVLVIAHTGRAESLDAARTVLELLVSGGVTVVLPERERHDLGAVAPQASSAVLLGADVAVRDLELVVVLGGDGTILRAAELVRGTAVPVLGVNLGHVGFLAEAERDDLRDTIRRVVQREWDVEERLALEVRALEDGRIVHTDWALNEVTVEKASRERMLEVVVEIDGRPLTSFGCDGMVVSTPTGSTAYAFSAGGPVMWPTVDAILTAPLSAHALFARPVVVPPTSVVAIEVLRRTEGSGVLWCDGRRMHDLKPGARVEVSASDVPVRLARLHRDTDRFTDRLVRKFDLPVSGWRGPAEDRQR